MYESVYGQGADLMKKVFAVILILLALFALHARAEETTTIQWHGYTLTPMHYETLYNQQYLVRVACDGVPLGLLGEHMQEFELVYPDGTTAYTPKRIRVLDNSLNARSGAGTTDFFDVIFRYETEDKAWFDEMTLRTEPDGPCCALVKGSGHPERCAFTTSSGAYVVTFYSGDDRTRLGETLADAFNGQDVTMYLTGYTQSGESDSKNTIRFLDQFEFRSLNLYTSLDVSGWRQSDCLTALGIARAEYLPECPNVKRLAFTLNRYGNTRLPDFEKLPALEEIDLLLKAEWDRDQADLLTENSRPVRTCASLRTLNITAERGSILSTDPDLRIWLAAERAVAPELLVNGVPAGELDPGEDMDAATLSAIAAVENDAQLLDMYRGTAAQEPTGGKTDGKVIALVISRAGNIEAVSTDFDSADTFASLPEDRLAATPDEAEALVIVYPDLAVAGSYGGIFNAYSCTTVIAAVDLDTGTLLHRERIVTRQPHAELRLGSGENTGTYEVRMGLEALKEWLN